MTSSQISNFEKKEDGGQICTETLVTQMLQSIASIRGLIMF